MRQFIKQTYRQNHVPGKNLAETKYTEIEAAQRITNKQTLKKCSNRFQPNHWDSAFCLLHVRMMVGARERERAIALVEKWP